MKKLLGTRLIVNVLGVDWSFEGKLITVTSEEIILIDTRALLKEGQSPPIDGRVVIPRNQIVWCQVP